MINLLHLSKFIQFSILFAILFFDTNKMEQEHLRLVGYKAADDFLEHIIKTQ